MKFFALLGAMASPLLTALPTMAMHRHLIIGGRNATAEEFPSYVAGASEFLCGGTLIHEDVVLTASHCVFAEESAYSIFAKIGGIRSPAHYNRSDLDGEVIDTVCSEQHPDFSPETRLNDMALVKLAFPSSAPLMQLNFNLSVPSEVEPLTDLGYGVFGYIPVPGNESMPLVPDTLQVLSPIYRQPEDICANGSPIYNASIHICVDDPDADVISCQGDSGGPLLTEDGVQVGVLSFGPSKNITGECDGSMPDYFTNVAMYESYIKEGICRLSANPPADCPDPSTLRPLPASCLAAAPTAPAPSAPVPTAPDPAPTEPAPTKDKGDGKMKGKGKMSGEAKSEGGKGGGSKDGGKGGKKEMKKDPPSKSAKMDKLTERSRYLK